jgi:hemerythrin
VISFTQNHFAAEEKLMHAHDYNDYELHKKEHNQLTMSVLDLQKQFQADSMVLSQKVMDFLKDWLANHIHGLDKVYGPYFNAKGVA